jgi:hypothetical protein
MMERPPTSRRRVGKVWSAASLAAVLAGLLCLSLPATAAEDAAGTGGISVTSRRPGGQAPDGRAAEPQLSVEAATAAWRASAPRVQAPKSRAIARALEGIRNASPPEDEVYALVMVTDRRTGERVLFARGTPDPEIPRYLEDVRNSPPGLAFFETESGNADAEVEVAVRSVRVRTRRDDPDALSRDEEEEIDLRERNQGGGLSYRIEADLRRRILSGEIDLASHSPVPVSIALRGVPRLRLPKIHDPAGEGTLWAGLEVAAERERAIIARKRDTAERQRGLIAAIAAAGGKLRYASWTSGAVEALIPARAIPALAERSDVFSLEYIGPEALAYNSAGFQGDVYYTALGIPGAYDPYHDGSHGLSSTGATYYTSPVVIAQSEDCIDEDHPMFLDDSAGYGTVGSRGTFYDCDPSTCTHGGLEDCSSTQNHGTRVAQLMVGDFMDGQDSTVDAATGRQLSGTCPECGFVFMQDQNLEDAIGRDRTKTYDLACDLGVDIYESSVAGTSTSCDGNGSDDSAIQALVDCDVVYVQAAGNGGSGAGCSTEYPADHPWTFTVGGIDTFGTACMFSSDYYSAGCAYATGASQGGGRYDGGKGTATIIDIAAPYQFSNMVKTTADSPPTKAYGVDNGTSFSAPIVAGLMGRFLDWWHVHQSTSLFYDNRLRNFFLLFGDRSKGTAGTDRAQSHFSSYWGAGRVGLVHFDGATHYAVLRTECELGRNDTCSWTVALDPALTFYKAVVWHDGKNYSNEPAIGLTLNPSGCSTGTISKTEYDSKAMGVYSNDGPEGPLSGCTGMKITIENIPSGTSGSRTFHFAAYANTESERGE